MSSVPVIIDLNQKIQYSKDRQFTGILSIQSKTQTPWHLYFLVGQIVWANTKRQAKRRWHRQLLTYCPALIQKNPSPDQVLTYQALAKLVMRKQFSREQFSTLVAGCISEILFDIIQQGTLSFRASRQLLTYKANPQDAAKFPCIALQHIKLWEKTQQDWQHWEQSTLIDILPNQAPIIVDPKSLREKTSLAMFRALIGLVDGQQTLRDLALRVKQPLVPLTLSLLPHMRNDLIQMVDVDSLESGSAPSTRLYSSYQNRSDAEIHSQSADNTANSVPVPRVPKTSYKGPTILYIDDSPADSNTMGQIIQAAGYRYVNIADPLQALPQLLEIKPQLIFLDLVMPVANGYELCAQIRRISAFRDTPIVIVTNNDGIADRVRAKVVGASGFMGKPIKQQRVLKVLKKYTQVQGDRTITMPQHSELSPST